MCVLTYFSIGTVGVVAARGHGGGGVAVADDGVGVVGLARRGSESGRVGRGGWRAEPVVHPPLAGRLVEENTSGATGLAGRTVQTRFRLHHLAAPSTSRVHQVVLQVHRAPQTPLNPAAGTRAVTASSCNNNKTCQRGHYNVRNNEERQGGCWHVTSLEIYGMGVA